MISQGATPIRVSAVVPTRNGARRLPACLPRLVEICDEVVVLVDSTTTDDTADVARRYTDRVFGFEHDDAYRNMQVAMFDRARGDWFLWVDDDETLSPQWTRPLLDEVMATRTATHVLMPIRWIVPGGERAIVTGRWYPNLLPRLFRNIRSIATFGTTPHEILWMAGEALHVPDLHVYHWNLVLKDRAERERIADFYVRMDPANACIETYLYEDEEFDTAPFEDRPVDAIVRAVAGVPAESLYAVDLRVVDAPARLRTGNRYTFIIEAVNRTARTFTTASRYLYDTPFSLAIHWWKLQDGDEHGYAFGIHQTPMPATLEPMSARRYMVGVDAPSEPGRYRLVPDLLERDVAWFSQAAGGGEHGACDVDVYAPG